MKTEEIIHQFKSHPALTQTFEYRHSGEKHINWQGLAGSGVSFAISALFEHLKQPFLVIAQDDEQAVQLLHDLDFWAGPQKVFHFCSSYKKSSLGNTLIAEKVRMRTESLLALQNNPSEVLLVSTPEALIEKTLAQESLQSGSITIELNSSQDLDNLVEQLNEMQYKKVEFVYEPGEFATRGSIVDIFSFSHDEPFRIELDGNEVESIRQFSPQDQRSIQSLNSLSIAPYMSQQGVLEAHIFEYIPAQTLCIFMNKEPLLNVFKAVDAAQSNPGSFLTPEECITHLGSFPSIDITQNPRNTQHKTVQFRQQIQPQFGKSLDRALNHLKENELNGFNNCIFSEQELPIKRLNSIIQDKQRILKIDAVYAPLGGGFLDLDLKLACYTEHQIFNRLVRHKSKRKGYNAQSTLTLKELQQLKKGDFITHIDHGVGIFDGLQKMDFNGKIQEVVKILYKDRDQLFVGISSLHKISRYSGKEGSLPKLHKLGSGVWEKQKQVTKKKVKEMARELILLYAERKSKPGFAFSPDTYLQHELEASFFYEDTPDQAKANEEVKRDMEKDIPMDRLLCGDVGFGKTEVALRAAFKAVSDSKQVAILVPTTLLAYQHFRTFSERLDMFPVKIDYLNRFKTPKEQKKTIEEVKSGAVDILIGTHRILSKDLVFKNLGLLIIDEEQKFGVSAKEKLKRLRSTVDTLTLTATPIPRTLHFSLMGARDLSVISTPPQNRQSIQTELHVFNKETITHAIEREVMRGGQVFFVHNRVQDIEKYRILIEEALPGIRCAVAHGQMQGSELEDIMMQFVEKEYDVLVSTRIIETGLDISNGNTMIINNAHHFGLSDLHQLRGRVGRSQTKAYCLLLSPPLSSLNDTAKKRLRTIEELSDLGSGFQIAMRDLDIRGAGNLLGGEQSGFISDMGFDMYHKILDEAVRELKNEEFTELFDSPTHAQTRECSVDTDFETLLPDSYVSAIDERLQLYQQLSEIESDEDLQDFMDMLKDRFGPLPKAAIQLLDSVRLAWRARKLGFEKMVLKKGQMKMFYPSDPNHPVFNHPVFNQTLGYIGSQPSRFVLKQTSKSLIIIAEYTQTIQQALMLLESISANVLSDTQVQPKESA